MVVNVVDNDDIKCSYRRESSKNYDVTPSFVARVSYLARIRSALDEQFMCMNSHVWFRNNTNLPHHDMMLVTLGCCVVEV